MPLMIPAPAARLAEQPGRRSCSALQAAFAEYRYRELQTLYSPVRCHTSKLIQIARRDYRNPLLARFDGGLVVGQSFWGANDTC